MRAPRSFGTLAAIFGWLLTPINWKHALVIWGYALVWLFINNALKVLIYHWVNPMTPEKRQELEDVEFSSENGSGENGALKENDLLRRIIEVGVLCNDAELDENGSRGEATGDPMEIALLRVGRSLSLSRGQLQQERPRKRNVPFDTEVMMMATFQQTDDGY